MRLRLSTLLIAINVGLLLLAVAGVAGAAVGLLRQLADAQALQQVTQAGLNGRQAILLALDDLATTAQLLAERPTLQRLAQQDDRAALTMFLEQFQRTSRLGSCAVLREGQFIAGCGETLPWDALWSARHADTPLIVYRSTDATPLTLAAWIETPGLPGVVVLVARPADTAFMNQVSAQVGTPIRLTVLPIVAAADDQAVQLQARVAAGGAPLAEQVAAAGNYVAAVPFGLPGQENVAVVEAVLPTSSRDRALGQVIGWLLLVALAVALVAGAVSFLIGRWLGRPLHLLTRAAAQIGRGDLETPVPPATGMEIGTLATTLEEMRRRLLRLTDDLRRQQAEAQAIVNGIVEGVYAVDHDRRVRYLNPQAAALLGIAPDAAIGVFCGDLLNPEGPQGRPCATTCPILHARYHPGARATEQLLLGDGRRRVVVITSAPPTEGLQVQVMRDETDLEAIRRMRDVVLSNISHEFRTPLSAQLASIELLLDRLPDLSTEQIGQLARSLQRGTMRLTQLIDNLLESVRIEAGKDTIRHQSVALDDVVEAAVELMRPLAEQRHQEILIELPYPLPPIRGDGPRLTQVFVNLLANANKFAPPGSPIRVGGVVHDETIVLWVEDRGPGVPAVVGSSLFERFVRAGDTEPEQSGIGLGLWIVKSIVERHHGSVGAHSVDGGTQVYIVLPREDEVRYEDSGR
jgi:signal transduction histidine kinase